MSEDQFKKIFSKNLKYYMSINEKTQNDIIKDLGINKSAISTWCNGTRLPRMDKVDLLAKYFGIDKSDLIEDRSLKESLSISNENESVMKCGGFSLGRYRIPVVATVAAGEPIFSEESILEWIDYDKDPRGEVFGLRIKGDSMIPRINDGDTIVVDKSAVWEDGDIVVVTVNGNDGTCKRIKKYKDGITLISLNPSYEPMYYTKEQVIDLPVRVVGRVMESRSRF